METLDQLDGLGPVLGGVVSQVGPSQLDEPTPCADFTVRGVLEHMIGGATMFAATFRGAETAPTVPTDIGDPVLTFAAAMMELVAAIRSPGALDRKVDAPFGRVEGDTFARFVVLDGLVHGWDLATATGQAYEPPDELVATVDSFARQAISPDMRGAGMFAAEAQPPADASPMERLVAFTGRTVPRIER